MKQCLIKTIFSILIINAQLDLGDTLFCDWLLPNFGPLALAHTKCRTARFQQKLKIDRAKV